jgi:hypothetical protein
VIPGKSWYTGPRWWDKLLCVDASHRECTQIPSEMVASARKYGVGISSVTDGVE